MSNFFCTNRHCPIYSMSTTTMSKPIMSNVMTNFLTNFVLFDLIRRTSLSFFSNPCFGKKGIKISMDFRRDCTKKIVRPSVEMGLPFQHRRIFVMIRRIAFSSVCPSDPSVSFFILFFRGPEKRRTDKTITLPKPSTMQCWTSFFVRPSVVSFNGIFSFHSQFFSIWLRDDERTKINDLSFSTTIYCFQRFRPSVRCF